MAFSSTVRTCLVSHGIKNLFFFFFLSPGLAYTRSTLADKRTGNVVQWWRTCLACTRPRVQPPVPHNKQTTKKRVGGVLRTHHWHPTCRRSAGCSLSEASPLSLLDCLFVVAALFRSLWASPSAHSLPTVTVQACIPSFKRVLIWSETNFHLGPWLGSGMYVPTSAVPERCDIHEDEEPITVVQMPVAKCELQYGPATLIPSFWVKHTH